MKGQKQRQFSLSILKRSGIALTFYPRLKINMYLDEYLKYLDEF